MYFLSNGDRTPVIINKSIAGPSYTFSGMNYV